MKKFDNTPGKTNADLINQILILKGVTALFFGMLVYLVAPPSDLTYFIDNDLKPTDKVFRKQILEALTPCWSIA